MTETFDPENPRLVNCVIRVDGVTNTAVATYLWEGNSFEGCDRFDDDMEGWTDDEIREHACALIGIEDEADRKKVEVRWV